MLPVLLLMGRSPHGERGLKYRYLLVYRLSLRSLPTRGAWIEISGQNHLAQTGAVAPHTGSVD